MGIRRLTEGETGASTVGEGGKDVVAGAQGSIVQQISLPVQVITAANRQQDWTSSMKVVTTSNNPL